MKEQFLNDTLSKQFKSLGFDEECVAKYSGDVFEYAGEDYIDNVYRNSYSSSKYCYAAPTINQAEQFLIDKYGCHVVVIPEPHKTGINYNWQVLFYDPTDELCWAKHSTGTYGDNGEYPTDRAARLAGIEKAVTIINTLKL